MVWLSCQCVCMRTLLPEHAILNVCMYGIMGLLVRLVLAERRAVRCNFCDLDTWLVILA
jgi:hypothetical protein